MKKLQATSTTKWILFGVFVVLNVVLKFLYLDTNSISWDEPFSIYHAQMDVSKIIHHLYQGNNPPLFEIMLHYWIKWAGISPFSVRFLPAVFSSMTAGVVFLIGWRFISHKAGIFAALLFTGSNFHLFFAHEARVYAWFGLLTVSSMYVFFSLLENQKSTARWIALVLLNATLMYSHYFGVFLIAIQGLSVLFVPEIRRKMLVRYLISGVATFLLFLPNVVILANRLQVSATRGTWIEKPTGVESLYNMLWNFSNQPVTTVICIALLVAALVKKIILWKKSNTTPQTQVVLIWFLFPFLSLFAISYAIPMFLDRYLVFVSFGYYLSVAVSVHFLFRNQRVNTWMYGAVALLFVATLKPNLDNKRHAQEAIAYVKKQTNEQTSILICGHDFVLNFCYYYDIDLFRRYNDQHVYQTMTEELNKKHIYPLYKMDSTLPLQEKVIYFDAAADFSNPNNGILETLKQRYTLVNTTHFEAIFTVYEFRMLGR